MAFERLDSDHKGYITLDDITNMLGSDALHSEDLMRDMWVDSMKAMHSSQARITYEDFRLLMKGQTRDPSDSLDGDRNRDTNEKSSASQLGLLVEEQSDELISVEATTTTHRPLPKAHSSPDLTAALSEWTFPSVSKPSPFAQQNKPALQQDRHHYRAHKQMRLSVLDASKRFEEQQTRHARDVLLAQEELREMTKGPAGLIMRRVENKTVSTEQIKKMLDQNQKYRVSVVEVANRRSGRGILTETISDIGGML